MIVARTIVAVVIRDGRLRRAVDEAALHRLQGRRIERVRRRGKYLLVDIEDQLCLLLHLGMSGRLTVAPQTVPSKPHDHLVWGLDDGREIRFNDARRFGLVEVFARQMEATHPCLVDLGPEPLGDDFTDAYLFARTRGSKRAIKPLLMDAALVVGVGNIYACEALYAAGIHPMRQAKSLSRRSLVALVQALQDTLRAAIAQGGTTLRDFVTADGRAGYFAVRLRVYGREGEACDSCGGTVERLTQSGRSTFFCRGCQR